MATAADWMSAATFISMAGTVAISGYDAARFLMGWTGGFVLLSVLMVPYLRKFNQATVPDFIAERYYSKWARAVAVLCALFICMTYIMGQRVAWAWSFRNCLELESPRVFCWGEYCFFLCWVGWDERNYAYASGSILCDGLAATVPAIFLPLP